MAQKNRHHWLLLTPIWVLLSHCGVMNLDYSAVHSPASGKYVTAETAESRIKIMDRHSMLSTLSVIFEADESLISGLLSDPQIFGGSLDPYRDGTFEYNDASLNPVSMSSREALRIKSCDIILQNDEHIQNAVKNAFSPINIENSIDAILSRTPGDSNIQRLHSLFHPGETPSKNVVDDLFRLSEEAARQAELDRIENPELEAWRYVLLALCLDPGWQIL